MLKNDVGIITTHILTVSRLQHFEHGSVDIQVVYVTVELKTFSSHLQKLQTLLDVLHLLLVVLDHLLHLLAVRLRMDRVRDVGRSRRHAARRSNANAHSRDDEGGSRGEGRQDEAGDGGDGPGHAGHPPADTGLDGFLVKAVGCVGQTQELQDALLQGGAALVEEADEETSCHEDTIGCVFHSSEARTQGKDETDTGMQPSANIDQK